MLKNCKGVGLLDSVFGISIVLVFLSFALPALTQLQEERRVILQKQHALHLMNEKRLSWLHDNYEPVSNVEVIPLRNTTFTVTWNFTKNKLKLCISFPINNNRKESLCSYAKKHSI
jgi:hypothetical protein